jgi:MinD-like ATPase involved in chromosome partitioning or flagellar assembly
MLLPANSTELSQPATWGWRGQVAKLTGGRVAMEPTPEEVRWREARLAVRQSYSRPLSVVFANPKGGAGKTPATACVASTFGVMRGGGVVAWDNNETRGTLAVRTQAEAHAHTVWDLLAHLDWFERPDARLGDLDQFMRNQGESYYDVLASDEHPGNMAQIGRDEFARLRAVLERYYRIICIDTGNNVRAANWQASIEAADLLVVCTSWRRDDAYTAAWMLDHLEQSGHRKLIERAVTVVSSRDRQIDGALRGQVLEHFGARTSAVVEIPFDPHLAMGERISYPALQRSTQDAWLLASAAIAHGLAFQDQTSKEIRLN